VAAGTGSRIFRPIPVCQFGWRLRGGGWLGQVSNKIFFGRLGELALDKLVLANLHWAKDHSIAGTQGLTYGQLVVHEIF